MSENTVGLNYITDSLFSSNDYVNLFDYDLGNYEKYQFDTLFKNIYYYYLLRVYTTSNNEFFNYLYKLS